MTQLPLHGGVGTPLKHDSAHLHVTGEATYTDDIVEPRGTLYAALGRSSRPHARIKRLDLAAVRAAPGVVAVATAADVPGDNNCGPLVADEPVFADTEVQFAGQVIFGVAASSMEAARRAARLAVIEYEDLPAVLTVEEALAQQLYVLPTRVMQRGNAREKLAEAPHRLRGRLAIGGQDHFYLEGQVSLVTPLEDGTVKVQASTQNPSEIQHLVARVLGRPDHDVLVECRRMGGAFGGKETQCGPFACAAAVLARKTRRPVKIRLDRDDDMIMTGKRHDFLNRYDVGFDDQGRILAIEMELASRCGWSADLSGSINDRAMFHADNCYYLDHVTIISHRCKTHTVSNTAFRGFGGPQGMLTIEQVVDEIARYLGKDPLEVRKLNFYGQDERNLTPYQMQVEDFILPELIAELEVAADYHRRRQEIEAFNAGSPVLKKGLSLTPVKFGISFTATFLNQAGALVHVYKDGSVLLNHGGTEMGQGLHVKVAQVVAEVFQIDVDHIRITATDTSKVPNTSATAASSGADMNGRAALAAAQTIKDRLVAFAAQHFEVPVTTVEFVDNRVRAGAHVLTFAELVSLAYHNRVSLSATGYYRTPKIHYDEQTLTGRPFYYFAYGAAVSEVVIDTLTGESKVLRVDLLHDAGRSLNPAIDLGQVEGGFVQGMGWLTMEELWWNPAGELKTHAPSTYKIPVASDLPPVFNARLWQSGCNREENLFRSKAVGEPPLMLANSVFLAIKDAIASVAGHQVRVPLNAPATAEEILRAVEAVKRPQAQPAGQAVEEEVV